MSEINPQQTGRVAGEACIASAISDATGNTAVAGGQTEHFARSWSSASSASSSDAGASG